MIVLFCEVKNMEENLNLDLSVADELWVRVIAQEMLKYARAAGEEAIARKADSEAVRILSEIKKALDDPSLDDPECFYRIDAIVDAFYQAGLSTQRHRECE